MNDTNVIMWQNGADCAVGTPMPRPHFPHAATDHTGRRFVDRDEVAMPTQQQCADLRQAIRNDLAALRIWREMGDDSNAEITSHRIDLQLDRLRRYERQDHEATTHR